MTMRNRSVVLCVLLLASFLAVFCSPSVKCADWRQVTRFTGSGTQQLDTVEFRINGSEWRIVWSYNPNSFSPSLTVFSFFIYRHSETTPMEEHVYESGADNTSGVLYVHEGPKLYYLQILTANTEGYTITVEYDKDSEVGTGLLIAIIALVIAIPVVIMVVIVYFTRKKYRKQKPSANNTQPPPPPPPPPT